MCAKDYFTKKYRTVNTEGLIFGKLNIKIHYNENHNEQ